MQPNILVKRKKLLLNVALFNRSRILCIKYIKNANGIFCIEQIFDLDFYTSILNFHAECGSFQLKRLRSFSKSEMATIIMLKAAGFRSMPVAGSYL